MYLFISRFLGFITFENLNLPRHVTEILNIVDGIKETYWYTFLEGLNVSSLWCHFLF